MHKKVCHKKKIKFEIFRNCLVAAQLGNKINYLEKTETNLVLKNS